MKGIKKRLFKNYIVIILIILFLFEGMFIILIRNYYYNNIEQSLKNRASLIGGFYSKYINGGYYSFDRDVKEIVNNFSFEENAELQIIDVNGSIIYSSSGFNIGEKVKTKDYKNAIGGEIFSWVGKNKNTDEKIMAVSAPLKTQSGSILGIIRYITTLDIADSIIQQWILFSLIIILIIVFFVFILSLAFSRSIINPINEITNVSKKIAKGQLGERIEKQYNDEIGQLAETINYMAGEIDKVQKLKNEFISSISHELRTPLTSIKGWGETILTGEFKDQSETEQGIKIIIKEANRLTKMVEELLDFSKLESGKIVLQLDNTNIKKEFEEVIYILESRAKNKKIDIKYVCDSTISEILADKNRLKQVFINILDNAIKFSQNGKSVFTRIYEKNDCINIEIEDYGIGISKEEITKVCQKFYKVNQNKSGSGLGLAISNEIINLHGGEFNIESEMGKGTKVLISLPKPSI
ncbi:sensor histidine kinase [Maledivibacter halophilus]|uniref:sensor histidine kinase n=1 Tax=Maledivibacter halophilus TaxID=36842 RepID=UPI0009A661C9|nr:HAMP domain-containing sensor histidine kinase [Maledivibacter halophilus]